MFLFYTIEENSTLNTTAYSPPLASLSVLGLLLALSFSVLMVCCQTGDHINVMINFTVLSCLQFWFASLVFSLSLTWLLQVSWIEVPDFVMTSCWLWDFFFLSAVNVLGKKYIYIIKSPRWLHILKEDNIHYGLCGNSSLREKVWKAFCIVEN